MIVISWLCGGRRCLKGFLPARLSNLRLIFAPVNLEKALETYSCRQCCFFSSVTQYFACIRNCIGAEHEKSHLQSCLVSFFPREMRGCFLMAAFFSQSGGLENRSSNGRSENEKSSKIFPFFSCASCSFPLKNLPGEEFSLLPCPQATDMDNGRSRSLFFFFSFSGNFDVTD